MDNILFLDFKLQDKKAKLMEDKFTQETEVIIKKEVIDEEMQPLIKQNNSALQPAIKQNNRALHKLKLMKNFERKFDAFKRSN